MLVFGMWQFVGKWRTQCCTRCFLSYLPDRHTLCGRSCKYNLHRVSPPLMRCDNDDYIIGPLSFLLLWMPFVEQSTVSSFVTNEGRMNIPGVRALSFWGVAFRQSATGMLRVSLNTESTNW